MTELPDRDPSTAPPDASRPAGQLLRHTPGPTLDKGRLRRATRVRRHLMSGVLRITAGLASDYAEREEHLDAIRGAIQDDHVWELHGWLHENLIILDDKAASILTLNSIGIATLTFLYSTFDAQTPWWMRAGTIVTGLIFLWAVIPMARISFVYWSTTSDFRQHQKLLNDLLLVRDKRTALIRGALVKDLAALVVFLTSFAADLLWQWLA